MEAKQQYVANEIQKTKSSTLMGLLKNSEEGAVFIGMLIAQTGFFSNSHVNSATNPADPVPNELQTAFLEGKRYIGEQLYSWLYDLSNPDQDLAAECLLKYKVYMHNAKVQAEFNYDKLAN